MSELGLSHNAITDVSAIGNLTELTWLDLGHNLIQDVTPLAKLVALKHLLNLGNNRIRDASPLAALKGQTFRLVLTGNEQALLFIESANAASLLLPA